MKYRVGWYKVKLEKEAGMGLRRPSSEFMTIIQFRGWSNLPYTISPLHINLQAVNVQRYETNVHEVMPSP